MLLMCFVHRENQSQMCQQWSLFQSPGHVQLISSKYSRESELKEHSDLIISIKISKPTLNLIRVLFLVSA